MQGHCRSCSLAAGTDSGFVSFQVLDLGSFECEVLYRSQDSKVKGELVVV